MEVKYSYYTTVARYQLPHANPCSGWGVLVAAGAAHSRRYPMAKTSQDPCRVDWPWVWPRLERLVQARRPIHRLDLLDMALRRDTPLHGAPWGCQAFYRPFIGASRALKRVSLEHT